MFHIGISTTVSCGRKWSGSGCMHHYWEPAGRLNLLDLTLKATISTTHPSDKTAEAVVSALQRRHSFSNHGFFSCCWGVESLPCCHHLTVWRIWFRLPTRIPKAADANSAEGLPLHQLVQFNNIWMLVCRPRKPAQLSGLTDLIKIVVRSSESPPTAIQE
jgi:hypothetical protein